MGELSARWTYSLYNSQNEFGNSFQVILQLVTSVDPTSWLLPAIWICSLVS